ncbi:hypothetical protein [Klebsiella spallanzanii]|uniref:hypothetical protein n=1 Tax=Klebsiella spallanzanii TaxID=2587528 RepID=UPI0011594D22|nr:hypothetical protein [Klebsiella spallanzanii]
MALVTRWPRSTAASSIHCFINRKDPGGADRATGSPLSAGRQPGQMRSIASGKCAGSDTQAWHFPGGAALTGLRVHRCLRAGSPGKAFTPQPGESYGRFFNCVTTS